MKLILTILLLLGTVAPAMAERIAVLDLKPVGADPILTQAVSENLRTMIIVGGKFEVVERAQLDDILAEHRLEQTGIIEDSDARKIGSLANVDLILLGSLSQMFDTYTINARLIDVATGVVRQALKADVISHAEFPRKIDELALRISAREEVLPTVEAPDLNGTYQVRGNDYVGLVSIRKSGEIYLMTWEIDNSQTDSAPQTYSGWGLLHGGVLSAYYHDAEEPGDFGISTYEVLLGGKQLRGLYCDLGTAGTYGKVNFENGVKQ